MWALGDYHRFAKHTVWELGPRLVEACGIAAGQRVLDVAAGTRHVAIPPLADGEFDVVTSSLGAIFAPDQQRVADELVRVCRPGGTVGMLNFTPEGLGGEFFALFGRHAPPPEPGTPSPVLWGSEDHVRALFAGRLDPLRLTRDSYVERSPDGPAAYCEFFKETFGPAV